MSQLFPLCLLLCIPKILDNRSGAVCLKTCHTYYGIWSENGTSFVVRETKLHENIEELNNNNIAAERDHNGIKWEFKLSSDPNHGKYRRW